MDSLDDFVRTDLTLLGETKTVFRKGTGPAVIVICEIPGITPQVADFARRVVDLGATVVMPSMFGTPGKPMDNLYAISSIVKGCVAKEFTTFATNKTSTVTVWLRELARLLHEECGGPGVGAIGMCFTGGFALAMTMDDRVVAPVLSQPSLPLPTSSRAKRDLGLSPADLSAVKARVARDDVCVLGLRFSRDPLVPAARFARLEQELGDNFIGVTIDSSPGNAYGIPTTAHSVVTADLKDEPGHPTHDALNQVLHFFTERLRL